jgi:uncharacterized protein YidB (DUF937 family)
MGLLDTLSGTLKNVLGKAQAAAGPELINAALAKSGLGDLQGLIAKLEAGGLGAQVRSWLGDGRKLPVSPEQLRAALGNEQVRHLAERFGLPVDDLLKLLSEHLPGAVSAASEGGALSGASTAPRA